MIPRTKVAFGLQSAITSGISLIVGMTVGIRMGIITWKLMFGYALGLDFGCKLYIEKFTKYFFFFF